MRKTLLLGFILMILLTACSKTTEIPTGTYRADGDQATVVVQDDNQMMITGPKETSAAFTGQYIIEDDKLTLTIPEQDAYIFFNRR